MVSVLAKTSFGPSLSTVARVYGSVGAERTNPFHVLQDHSGDCTDPKTVVAWGHAFEKPSGVRETSGTVEFTVRCRKCDACRTANAHHWAFRAQRELEAAQRTWFVTLTLNPAMQMMIAARKTTPRKLLTLWVKRIRKAGYKVRYFAAFESHKSGDPHIHVLLHEHITSKPIPSRLLSGNQHEGKTAKWWWFQEEKWKPKKGHEGPFFSGVRIDPAGHVHCRLVDTSVDTWDAAFYVCKYIKKEVQGRTPASLDYGGGPWGGLWPTPS